MVPLHISDRVKTYGSSFLHTHNVAVPEHDPTLQAQIEGRANNKHNIGITRGMQAFAINSYLVCDAHTGSLVSDAKEAAATAQVDPAPVPADGYNLITAKQVLFKIEQVKLLTIRK